MFETIQNILPPGGYIAIYNIIKRHIAHEFCVQREGDFHYVQSLLTVRQCIYRALFKYNV